MAIFGDKDNKELVTELIKAKTEVEMLNKMLASKDEDLDNLRTQLYRTQEALIAKEAPEAYFDQKAAEKDAIPPTPEELEKRDKARHQAELDQKLLEDIEGPLFKSAEEMQDLLMRPSMGDIDNTKPLHPGGES